MFIKIKVLHFLCWLNTSLFSVRIIRIGTVQLWNVMCFCTLRPNFGTDRQTDTQSAVRIHKTGIWYAVAVSSWHAASPRIPCEMYQRVTVSVMHRPVVIVRRIACLMRQLLRLSFKANNLNDRRFQYRATRRSQCDGGSSYCGVGS